MTDDSRFRLKDQLKIAVAGTGYVGLSLSVLLSQNHKVMALDILPSKVDQINAKQSPIEDPELAHFLAHKTLHLHATLDPAKAFAEANLDRKSVV